MRQLALVGLEDADVDVLTRVRRRDDLSLAAVYHPDSNALIVRLAGLAGVPVVTDPVALRGLPVEIWINGKHAAAILDDADPAGVSTPVCVPVSEIDLFLDDPDRYGVTEEIIETVEENESVAVGATAAVAHAMASPAAGPPAGRASPAAEPKSESPDSQTSVTTRKTQDPDTRGEEPTTVTRKDAPPAKSDAHHTPAPQYAARKDADAPAVAEAEPSRSAVQDDGDADDEPGVNYSLGNPSMELLYDPIRFGTWLADSACRVAGGSAAVLWRRESEGKRYTLVAYAPGADALPTIALPPAQLEEYVRAGRVQAVSPDDFVTPDTAPLPFRFLAVPLPGDRQAFGLVGVFRPVAAGDFPRGALTELSARAAELGVAVERCFQFARMGQELRGLRFKERVRDMMFETGLSETDRWSRLLQFLLDEVPADFAQFYGLVDEGRRLSLTAVASRHEEFEGLVSIPVGRGLIGSAVERETLSVYTSDDHDSKGLYILPVQARRSDGMVPVGVIVLDGAPERSGDGQETTGVLEMTGSIMAPLLANMVTPARA